MSDATGASDDGSFDVAAAVAEVDDGVTVRIHAQPGAKRTELVGLHGDALKVRIAAPPVDGKANAELCRFLAKRLGVRAKAVTVEAGATGRAKVVRVAGMATADVVVALATPDRSRGRGRRAGTRR